MNRHQFAREFPQHAKLAERLEAAINYAEGNFGHAEDRERFVKQARDRIAERIAEGRSAASHAPDKPAPRGRTVGRGKRGLDARAASRCA